MTKLLLDEEVRLSGQGVSSGIAIGKLVFSASSEVISPLYNAKMLGRNNISEEIDRFRDALYQSRLELEQLKNKLENDQVDEGVEILDAQLQMMHDPLITQAVEDEIRSSCQCADSVFCAVIQRCEERLKALADPTVCDRYSDIEDVARRVLRHLRSWERATSTGAVEGCIVYSPELVASETAEALENGVVGFITKKGGMTSHSAIVARAGHIPYVTHIDVEPFQDYAKILIIDGSKGEIILNPSRQTLSNYKRLQRALEAKQRNLEEIGMLSAETYDGYGVRLSANLEIDSDLEALHRFGGSGVGLFRSEHLMLARESFPSEAEQFICYRRIVRQMHGLPAVIRVFDIGGDKIPAGFDPRKEANPYLGWRAIRLLLREPHILRTQLRAILRASAFGDVGVMFPLISGVQELIAAKQILYQVREELRTEGQAMGERVRIGCMIEVPSAAMIADLLAKECDFLSIGTNDLVQYTLAVDRGNPALSGHYTPAHPGVLRLIRLVVTEANRQNIPVAICGEVAADPRYTALLLGLGIHELSVSPRHIPIIKQTIRNTSIVEAAELADRALSLPTSDAVMDLLISHYNSPLSQ